MVGWHHRLNGHEFEQAPGVGDGQGSLACCSPWGHKIRHISVTELTLEMYAISLCQIYLNKMIFKKVVGGGTYPGHSSVFTGTTLWRIGSDQLFLFISVGSVELLSDSCCCCCC